MNSVRVHILNPKARRLLEDLADLNLISISEPRDSAFMDAVMRIRSKTERSSPSLEVITKEVELVRSRRYGKNRRKSNR